ncbi:uncharacterized protein LOC123544984 [Mercenaria mercenaria]|uniref:uncharacterized protein LOC123544984 n=1 Tax=Mercenaria mercenaria TaxID=6596 RepID=UPI00234E3BFD|nr:uncharacterized protein LOC123544984 [Mercenaria mercenaria]XP_053395730.1 uncharacterized protein LOC123544984 [Mercenaria mercenaria]XP_053395737.1 uncharacterized protein LOC123544984 [Mercenaria mercenaria]XP_053395743.1 uncharacterized protein LOC123544984 [Mercenaria mercenaria]XP_053395747.1 uncharacterized protein LOC123544984 [Mercenaria mercenaria]
MDWVILLQAFLYFCISVLGFFVCIPVAVNRSNLDGVCFLYADVTGGFAVWYVSGSASSTCNFPIYFGVSGMVIVGLLAGLCFGYFAQQSRKDKEIGSRMWTLPFIPLNAVLTVFTLVVACILSVGIKLFCDEFESNGCETLEHNEKTRAFPLLSSLSQAGAWIGFLLYLIQTGISVLRFFLNRRLRQNKSKEKKPAPDDIAFC